MATPNRKTRAAIKAAHSTFYKRKGGLLYAQRGKADEALTAARRTIKSQVKKRPPAKRKQIVRRRMTAVRRSFIKY